MRVPSSILASSFILIACASSPDGDDLAGTGGASPSGGASSGGNSGLGSGGAASGGSNAGSSGGSVGQNGSGGGTGGDAAASGGGTATGGADAAGGAGTGGESGEVCPLPSTFQWTSTQPIAQPKSGWVSLKDFTVTMHQDKYVVYMTTHDTGETWGAAMFTFDDFAGAATATQQTISRTAVAPTLLYFQPKDIWVFAYQWGGPAFSYATSTDPNDPSKLSAGQTLFDGSITGSDTGPIDQTLICDSDTCYLFFAGDNGKIYRSTMPIADFPGTFGNAETIMTDTKENLFEAVQVYAVKGSDQYLMIVEAMGDGRYFRSFTSNDLGGEWTPHAVSQNAPFAGKANVTFEGGGAWTKDISHGDIVRDNPDQTMTIDPCNLRLLYQGRDPNINTDYGKLPYRPALLTLVR